MIEILPLQLTYARIREEALAELKHDPYSKYIADNIKLKENNLQWLQDAVSGNLLSNGKCFFAIFYGDGVFAGEIGVDKIDQERKIANVFYWIRPSLRNRGIAFAALDLFRKEPFLKDLNTLKFMVDKSNFQSERVLRKIGARKEVELEIVYPKTAVRLHNYFNLQLK